MSYKVWGVPLYSSTELLKAFKGSTMWPDVSGDVVLVPGADTMMYARENKLLSEKKTYLCLDIAIILRGVGIPLNGLAYQGLGIYTRSPLKKSEPPEWKPNSKLNSTQVLMRNSKRITNLVALHKKGGGKGLKSIAPWHQALNKAKDAEFKKRKDKGAGVKEEQDDEVKVAKERDE